MSQLKIGFSLSCIDYRLFEATIELLRQDCQIDAFDHTILAGASLGYNQNKYVTWSSTWLDHVNLAIKLHNIQKIVVIDHEDCGAYKLFYPDLKDHPKRERKYHIKNIKEFINYVRHIYPNMEYAGYLLNLDGSYERIYP
jgi:carbonic anhydrase